MKGRGCPDCQSGVESKKSKECNMSTKCSAKTEVYSRVCGFFRPVQQWNKGKKEEFKDRQEYVVEEGRG
ncbi:MAG: hypothetical protein KAU27_12790 [Desulfuromonadales bacterium]|nr:hypothetical protein [Desulfuromonadales bacterium]